MNSFDDDYDAECDKFYKLFPNVAILGPEAEFFFAWMDLEEDTYKGI